MVYRGGSLLADPRAHLKEAGWKTLAEIDAKFEWGEIDESGWRREVDALVAPVYLSAATPWGQSGKSGTEADWERSRSHVAHAIDGPGSFLDVGCAKGYLMECLPRWTPFPVQPYGLEIIPRLAGLARSRLPCWADRIWSGNAMTWRFPMRFTYIRTGLEYAPPGRQRDLVMRLLAHCKRLIIGVFNEHESERTVEQSLVEWGLTVTGRSFRPHPHKPGMQYRVLWTDA